ILAITTDNASNNNIIFRYFANYSQDLLKNLKAEGLNKNKILLDNEDIIST
ncbi:9626_t:CDS:2, partial [Cetraspora pellucida]